MSQNCQKTKFEDVNLKNSRKGVRGLIIIKISLSIMDILPEIPKKNLLRPKKSTF